MSTVPFISLISIIAHQEQRRKLTKIVNKKRVIYCPSPATASKFDWGKPAYKNTELGMKIKKVQDS